jgi:hypothetical protein
MWLDLNPPRKALWLELSVFLIVHFGFPEAPPSKGRNRRYERAFRACSGGHTNATDWVASL